MDSLINSSFLCITVLCLAIRGRAAISGGVNILRPQTQGQAHCFPLHASAATATLIRATVAQSCKWDLVAQRLQSPVVPIFCVILNNCANYPSDFSY